MYFDTGVLGGEPPGYEASRRAARLLHRQGREPDRGAAVPGQDVDQICRLDGEACANQTLHRSTGREAYYSSGFIPFQGLARQHVRAEDRRRRRTRHVPLLLQPARRPDGRRDHGYRRRRSVERSRRSTARPRRKPTAWPRAPRRYRDEKAGKSRFKGNFAGSGDDAPRTCSARSTSSRRARSTPTVGEKVTWTFIGNHTSVSTCLPYAPLFT